jgi:AcrR family transcriptional regulator
VSAREKILDAAARVMNEKGLARATTKEIAREAGYSEAALYKHFADKQEIFLGVLNERLPRPQAPADLVGGGTVIGNLEIITGQLLRFYVRTFPIAASIFSAPELLASWREGMSAKGAGPRMPSAGVERYLAGEIEAGRLAATVDPWATAALLVGAAMHQAFLANFEGLDEVPDADAVARRLVSAVDLATP